MTHAAVWKGKFIISSHPIQSTSPLMHDPNGPAAAGPPQQRPSRSPWPRRFSRPNGWNHESSGWDSGIQWWCIQNIILYILHILCINYKYILLCLYIVYLYYTWSLSGRNSKDPKLLDDSGWQRVSSRMTHCRVEWQNTGSIWGVVLINLPGIKVQESCLGVLRKEDLQLMGFSQSCFPLPSLQGFPQ